ncbi:MAG TPA: serine hydrolase domain-containing protein [Phycisphaerae bacterium]|nr:serine hydrolase domain-containing protein [Phycisphaerae bacterium]HUT60135.1 serine hydrolase domain-containing protein [Phycisphaerae bacterium]
MSDVKVDWPLERAEPESVGMSSQRLERIGEVVGRYIEAGRIAGAITVVSRRGKIVHLQCTGLMDIEKRKPMQEDAIFRIYSMTKLITSTAVLMLLEEGRFVLDEPASHFLPEMADLRVAVTGADGQQELVRPRRPVTIHDLLTHTSGIDYEFMHDAEDQGMDLARFVAEQCKRPLKHQPGTTWMYGASTDVLGRLIEVVSGQTLDVFLDKRIFEPLGMTDTGFFVPPEKVDRLARCYTPGKDGKLVPAEMRPGRTFLKKPSLLSGGGGLVSTTSDYLRLAQMLCDGGALGDMRLLSTKTVELMHADHLPAGHPALDGNKRGFGLGGSVLRRLGETHQIGSVGEFGWGGAACTQAWIDPAGRVVSIIMMQLVNPGEEKFLLMDLFKQAAYQAIVE